MKHDEYREKLSALLDEELDETEKAVVLEHLESCAACQTYLIELTALHNALSRMDTPSVPEGFADGVMARLHKNDSEKSIESVDISTRGAAATPRGRSRRVIASVAAAAAVLAIVSVPQMFHMGSGAPESAASSVRNAAVYGASGGTGTAAADAFPAETGAEEAEDAPMLAMEAPAEMAEDFNATYAMDTADGGSMMESKTTVTAAFPEARELEEAAEADGEFIDLTLMGEGAAEYLLSKGAQPDADGYFVDADALQELPDGLTLGGTHADRVPDLSGITVRVRVLETEAAP